MKNSIKIIATICCLLLASIVVKAEGISSVIDNTGFVKIYNKYVKADGISTVLMDSKMLKAMSYQKGIESIYIIKAKKSEAFKEDIYAYLSDDNALGKKFDVMGSTSENGELATFYIRQLTKDISEFILVSDKRSEFSIIRIYGNFEIDDVRKLKL